jgi:extradiol dioxygenase family protein
MDDWRALADKLERAGCEFLISPRVRFQGEVGEQATLFLYDPAANALEFKSFADPAQLFAS